MISGSFAVLINSNLLCLTWRRLLFLSLFMSTFFFSGWTKGCCHGRTHWGRSSWSGHRRGEAYGAEFKMTTVCFVPRQDSFPVMANSLVNLSCSLFLDSLFNKMSVDTIEFVFCSWAYTFFTCLRMYDLPERPSITEGSKLISHVQLTSPESYIQQNHGQTDKSV